MKIAHRTQNIEPFYVMEISKAAQELAQRCTGESQGVIGMNIGEPDFTAPLLVQQAAERAIRDGQTQYTGALGLDALRERISAWYAERFGVQVPARRIVVTAGASAALQLACLALLDVGDEVLIPDPSYPCNRHFVRSVDAVAMPLPVYAGSRYQPTAQQVAAAWGPRTRAAMLASPSNPTGTSIDPQELGRILEVVRSKGGAMLVDEIYLGLSYNEAFGHTALALGEDVISLNSFSKYFSMTGWRLGWMVVPEALLGAVERLAQNLYICASTVSQYAALACFERQSLDEYERRRAEFKARRDYLLPALQDLGLPVAVEPDGAFYVWANCSRACEKLGVPGSWNLAFALLDKARVALAPGRDFGNVQTAAHIRISYATEMACLQEAVARLKNLLC